MFAVITSSFSQESETKEEKFKPYHSISGLLSHTMIKDGIREGKTEWIDFPSFVLDYNYVFSPKWRIGLHNDIIFEDFIVETTNSEGDKIELERSEPIATVLVGGFKPGKHFTFEVGAGYELAKEEHLFLTRIGTEYAVELPHKWEFLVNIVYDIKWNNYDSFAYGVGVSKSFGK
ncbi:MAG TPA: hypothetical protein DCM02_05625 [Flavobacterium sp.]|nr:hypothetical protein [Flavobacterium sp.]HAT75464.1 hypothetical protein [Flavobacterium sp.]